MPLISRVRYVSMALFLSAATCLVCGTAAGSSAIGDPGFEAAMLSVDGVARSYRVHLPAGSAPRRGLPVVLVFHGGGGTGLGMERIAGFAAEADRQDFILVYPEGIARGWNDGRPETGAAADDVAFVRTLIDRLARDYAIDRTRVYATGISNGGLFSYRLACELPDRIAAVAAVAATMGELLARRCNPAKAIPILAIVGTEDPLVPFVGGYITGPFGLLRRGVVLSSDATMAFWGNASGCGGSLETVVVGTDPQTDTKVVKDVLAGCRNGVLLARYVVDGGGHTWPGGWQYLPERLVGKTTRAFSATHAIWSFFAAAHGESTFR